MFPDILTAILCLKEAEGTFNYAYNETSGMFQNKNCNTETLCIFTLKSHTAE